MRLSTFLFCLTADQGKRLTLAGTFDSVSNANGLAVVEVFALLDTQSFVAIILQVRHGFGVNIGANQVQTCGVS